MTLRVVLTLLMVLAVAGCGGGGGIERPVDPDTTVDPRGTSTDPPVDPVFPEKPVSPAFMEGFDASENIAGTDPRDTWKPTQPIQSYFDLKRYPPHPDPSRLRGTVLGSRDGITYTQQMSGPTDTIDIDFLWYGQSIPDRVLGIVERAGKAWSYRLTDVFGPHELTDGVVTRLGRDENGRAIPYHNDGLLVSAELRSYSSADFRTHQSDGDDFMARSSQLLLSANGFSCCGDISAGYLAAQEVGHALGHDASESDRNAVRTFTRGSGRNIA